MKQTVARLTRIRVPEPIFSWFLKLIYRFNTILLKIPFSFFLGGAEIDKLILKFLRKCKGTRIRGPGGRRPNAPALWTVLSHPVSSRITEATQISQRKKMPRGLR